MNDSLWRERIVLCLAVLMAYASVWPNDFVFDDVHLIVRNEFLKHWDSLPRLLTNQGLAGSGIANGFYRPVQTLIYFFVYQAFGPSTVAFHALSVGLQAFNACLLHHFGIRAGFKKGAAFAAALLWAVHPLHTSNIAYMASTAELLWSSFCLLGLIALLPDFAPRKILTAIIFFILALGCKETAVVFPALAAATFFFTDKNRAQFSAYLKMWPLWLLTAAYITVWMVFIHKTHYTMDGSGDPAFLYYASNVTSRILTCLATLPVYAGLIVWPAGLHIEQVFHVFPTLLYWQPMTGALMVGFGLLQILWAWFRHSKYSGRAGARRGLALSFGLLWFASALSPVTGIVFPIDALISEGWLYMPTMGLFLGVAQTAAGFFEKRQNAARLLVLILAFSLGITTFFQNEVWRNPETLYQNILQNGGRVDRLSDRLSMFYLRRQEFDRAIEQLQYALGHPDWRPKAMWANTHFLLAMAWLQAHADENDVFRMDEVMRAVPSSRHIPEAVEELGKALQTDPEYYWAHIVLSIIYRYQGNNQMADFHDRQFKDILKKQKDPGP